MRQSARRLQLLDMAIERKERGMAESEFQSAANCPADCECPGCEDCAELVAELGLVICGECGHAVAEKEVVR